MTKGHLIFSASILLVFSGPTSLSRLFRPERDSALSLLQNSPATVVPIVIGAVGFGILMLLVTLSIHIFEGKELYAHNDPRGYDMPAAGALASLKPSFPFYYD